MLPELPRAQGVQIPGGAFADLLMLKEFVHNFGEALDLGNCEIKVFVCFLLNRLQKGDLPRIDALYQWQRLKAIPIER